MENHLINKRLETAWLTLKRFHNTNEGLLGRNQFVDVLDLSYTTIKIPRRDWPGYIDALSAVIMIGRRNQWLDFLQNRNGQSVYWGLRKSAVTGKK